MDIKPCSSKYLNNLIEQDHRSVKRRFPVVLGFKRFRSATIMIVGVAPKGACWRKRVSHARKPPI